MPTVRNNPPSQADRVWKDALDWYFPEFVHCFFPDLAQQIDWAAGYQWLDKEFQKLTRKSRFGKRTVDQLVRVRFKSGRTGLLLIEIQGDDQAEFPQRVFDYFYRAYDRYQLPLLTLALLTDDRLNWRPHQYQLTVEAWPVLNFEFFSHKLLDYRGQEAALLAMDNPLGTMAVAQLAALATRPDPQARYERKYALTRGLYEPGRSPEMIRNLYHFIDGVLTLPPALEIRYNKAIQQLEKEKDMEYITSAERIGIRKGRKQGRQEGERRKALAIAKNMLDKGTDLAFIKEVTGLSQEEIVALMH